MTDMSHAKPPESFAFDSSDQEDDEVSVRSTTDASRKRAWAKAKTFDDFAAICCGQSRLKLLTDPDSFSLTQRAGRIGQVGVAELIVGSELAIKQCQLCTCYRVLVPQSGHTIFVRGGVAVKAEPGAAAVLVPEGHTGSQWAAGTRMIALRLNRCVVDDALSDAIGRQVTSQIDFAPVMPIASAATRSWANMLALFTNQLLRPNSLLNQPLVGLPFVDSLVRGFLLATNHPHRQALSHDGESTAPRTIRTAIEIMEHEAHLPLTLSSIAARSQASVRSLQQGFQRYLDTSPMAYLREVRLRRAHQALVESDPSTATVASVASLWGFSNLGRFANAYARRYGEVPSVTLRTARGPKRY
ncbi:AraC family transcriptional regulator [Mycobacterium intracellulare]|uniref:AraC family transcriptional regulator n=1 Tax=Mycobacterium intracellulare TaxID=1767 RepID=A0AAE4RAR0_MYCIT|nr:AraC family transcriptional regulator [Mycobacterium intracellulare]MCA2322566.1 AraC family transcriptional regulator [Mycobacterium intracellulare]MCA2343115.1 AraC family transcriptional regulator [Mycobacterium intracellulare]MDV6978047.1 AraC family transcriptional regulator [Mycobacterium intracellulare]MDV6983461.1 AraC family transcriptional regulator [Mycobacterium intracellulare]MDV7012175.1 AraC family transcriptional regulator [Mycobacterium intracellulare]